MRWIIILLLFFSLPIQAATYICVVNGKPVYVPKKIGDLCELSDRNTQGQVVFVPMPENHQNVDLNDENGELLPENHTKQEPDDLYHLWHELQYGSQHATPATPTVAPFVAKPVRRVPVAKKQPQMKSKPKMASQTLETQTKVKVEPVLPQIQRFNRVGLGAMNRRQILQQQLQREQATLNIVREQLAAARKRNDATAVQKYSNALLGHEQNVLAIMRQIKR